MIHFTLNSLYPGQYGVPRPWYFFVTKSYWFGSSITDTQDYLHSQGMELDQQQQSKTSLIIFHLKTSNHNQS